MTEFPPPPSQSIDWYATKGFQFHEVDGHVECIYSRSTGTWTRPKFVTDPYMSIHGMSPALNYGQQALEGFKAFRGPGERGAITLFRPLRNALRLQHSAAVLSMPSVPEDLFVEACRLAVARNAQYVPPNETGGSLYVRPQLYGSGAVLPPSVPDEFTFAVFAVPSPAGAHDGSVPVRALILDEFDRAAPRGTGHAKVGGNYAPVLRWTEKARTAGFGITLHLDSAHHEYVDEFSTCGFVGVHVHDGNLGPNAVTLVIPSSPSAIESVTSDSIQQIARSFGWTVEKRAVPYKELPEFSEVLGAGTGVSVVPIQSISRQCRVNTGNGNRVPDAPKKPYLPTNDDLERFVYIMDGHRGGGPVYTRLRNQLREIQLGTVADQFGWCVEVKGEDANLR